MSDISYSHRSKLIPVVHAVYFLAQRKEKEKLEMFKVRGVMLMTVSQQVGTTTDHTTTNETRGKEQMKPLSDFRWIFFFIFLHPFDQRERSLKNKQATH